MATKGVMKNNRAAYTCAAGMPCNAGKVSTTSRRIRSECQYADSIGVAKQAVTEEVVDAAKLECTAALEKVRGC